jgi:flagellar basal-body rod protein FlgG
MESLDMLANNLANSSTHGFKMDREYYTLYAPEEARDGVMLPEIDREWTDFRQGGFENTGNSLDLALDGKGFFVVSGPAGPLYTRGGALHVAKDGTVLSKDEYPIQLSDGRPLRIDPAQRLTITPEGGVFQNNQPLGALRLVDAVNGTALVKQGANCFRASDPGKPPVAATPVVRQGTLESSNVSTAESAVRMIGIMRQFEMLQRAISIGSEMNRKAAEEVARL